MESHHRNTCDAVLRTGWARVLAPPDLSG